MHRGGGVYQPPSGWSELPLDIAYIIFRFGLSFREKCSVSGVCKSWQKAVRNNIVGTEHLHLAGLKSNPKKSWLPLFQNFLKSTVHILALDCSKSMQNIDDNGLNRDKVAMANIALKCRKLEDIIDCCGIYCIAFGSEVQRVWLDKVNDIKDYFQKVFYDAQNIVGTGTNFNVLFNELIDLQEQYKNLGRRLSYQVTVISDFEDSAIDFNHLANHQISMQIECLRVGKGDGEGYHQRLQKAFKSWQDKEQQNKATMKKKSKHSFSKNPFKKSPKIKHKRSLSMSFTASEIELSIPSNKRQKGEDGKEH